MNFVVDPLAQVTGAGLAFTRHRHARFYAGRTSGDERVYVEIELRRTDMPHVPVGLSISGECFDGDNYRSSSGGGQIDDMVRNVLEDGRVARGCDANRLRTLLIIWGRWHMNAHAGFFGRTEPEPLPEDVIAWLRPLADKYDVGKQPMCRSCEFEASA